MSTSSLSNDPIDIYLKTLADTLSQISRQEIWDVVNALMQAWRTGKTVYICGNGGSAATASHMANDLNKYTLVAGKRRMRAISLSDNVPLITAWANDASYADIFAEQVYNFVVPGDILIAISASGNSPNVLRGVDAARSLGAITIGLTGDTGGKLKERVDYCVCIPDPQIGRQEDGHMILDHVIASTLHSLILHEPEGE